MKYNIVLTTTSGSKHFSLGSRALLAILGSIFFAVLVFMLSVFLLLGLRFKLGSVEQENVELVQSHQEVTQENTMLKANIHRKEDYLKQLDDSIAKINDMVGLSKRREPVEGRLEKVNLALMTAMEKKFMFDQVPSGNPTPIDSISSNFGWRIHPVTERKAFHNGIDIRTKINTPVMAPADGVVLKVSTEKIHNGYGKTVRIAHNWGFSTLYAHLNHIVVRKGDFVRKNDLIAYTGNTGRSTGPHLHYEVHYLGKSLNPAYFINWNMKNYRTLFQREHKIQWESLTANIRQTVTALQELQPSSQKAAKLQER